MILLSFRHSGGKQRFCLSTVSKRTRGRSKTLTHTNINVEKNWSCCIQRINDRDAIIHKMLIINMNNTLMVWTCTMKSLSFVSFLQPTLVHSSWIIRYFYFCLNFWKFLRSHAWRRGRLQSNALPERSPPTWRKFVILTQAKATYVNQTKDPGVNNLSFKMHKQFHIICWCIYKYWIYIYTVHNDT